jgi:hypothetical protein
VASFLACGAAVWVCVLLGVVEVGVVEAGVELAVLGDEVLCFRTTIQYPPAMTTTPKRSATSRSWREVSVSFMSLLSAVPRQRASLERGIRANDPPLGAGDAGYPVAEMH